MQELLPCNREKQKQKASIITPGKTDKKPTKIIQTIIKVNCDNPFTSLSSPTSHGHNSRQNKASDISLCLLQRIFSDF